MAAASRGGGRARQAGPTRRRPAARRGGVGGETLDRRIRLLRILFVIAFIAIGGRAIALASTSSNLMAIALRQQMKQVDLPAHRGAILDRSGQQLAVGRPAETIYATPYLLKSPRAAADKLARALQIRGKRARQSLLTKLSNPKSGFEYVARKVDPQLAAKALALKLPGVGAFAEEQRVYPMQTVAAQVLGFAGTDNTGLAGIELQYDKQLSGTPGSEVVVRDTTGKLALKTLKATQPVPGQDVRLTIDRDIQYAAERIIDQTVRAFQAKGAVAIVMNPKTGEIYAMANAPLVKSSNFGVDPAADRNRAVTDAFEPGSIFKTVTVAGALSEHLVTPGTKFTLPPTIKVADRVIHESHARGTVTYSVRDILTYSSNVGAVTIGEKLGKDRLLKWIDAFGFGAKTSIPFPGEVTGSVPQTWSGSTIGNVPMGQGISVTPLQVAQAYATVANGGVVVQPQLVAQVGTQVTGPAPRHRVISAKVAHQLMSMLTDVVTKGTGMAAQIPGYEVAGKTGTANIPLANGQGYSTTGAYMASFCGIVPANDPQLVVLVVVDSPRTAIWGSASAAPAVKAIATFALQHLEIAP
jgi:cell division protein FtsI (penicillin-binding protein 3)